MSIDILQAKIRKTKNPTMLEFAPSRADIPPRFADGADSLCAAASDYCQALLRLFKGDVPGVRLSFSAFALLGPEGLTELSRCLRFAADAGYYTVLDAPEILSADGAERTAQAIFGQDTLFPCDGVVIPCYLGSDILTPFLPYCQEGKKDVFVLVRSGNRSASQLQDLLAGSRHVHTVAADYVNRYGAETAGRFGYTRVGLMVAASSAESVRRLRTSYTKLFMLLEGYDYPNSNAKNCSYAFDRLGYGACICAGKSITCAWKQDQDGQDALTLAQAEVQRIKRNIGRYVTVL